MPNTFRVLRAWHRGEPLHASDSIWTDGRVIWSYQTAILARREDGSRLGWVVLNGTRYTNTTTRHQNYIRQNQGHNEELRDVPRGPHSFDYLLNR